MAITGPGCHLSATLPLNRSEQFDVRDPASAGRCCIRAGSSKTRNQFPKGKSASDGPSPVSDTLGQNRPHMRPSVAGQAVREPSNAHPGAQSDVLPVYRDLRHFPKGKSMGVLNLKQVEKREVGAGVASNPILGLVHPIWARVPNREVGAVASYETTSRPAPKPNGSERSEEMGRRFGEDSLSLQEPERMWGWVTRQAA